VISVASAGRAVRCYQTLSGRFRPSPGAISLGWGTRLAVELCYAFCQELPPRMGLSRALTQFHPHRIVLIAVAVGGIAGASVVLSLAERPTGEASVAARTLQRPAEFASVPADNPQAAQVKTQAAMQDQPTKRTPIGESQAASQSSTSSTRRRRRALQPRPKLQRRALPHRQRPRLIKRRPHTNRRCKRTQPESRVRRRVMPHEASMWTQLH
jgi:hypothetical protein